MKKRRFSVILLTVISLFIIIGALAYWYAQSENRGERVAGGRVLRFDADPENGFYWPYYLYVPDTANERIKEGEPVYLLVFPNNTGEPSDDLSIHDNAAREKIDQVQDIPDKLGTPLLIPVFPRPWEVYLETDLYVHALDRRILESQAPGLERVDLQLLSMMDDATARLSAQGIPVKEKALIMGFSASGMFANRFTLLHPERVLASSIGSPGGWPMAPVEEWQGTVLEYPLGTHGIEQLTGRPFDFQAFRSVRQFFFIGDQDDDDAVDQESFPFMAEMFGSTPLERWPYAEQLYRSAGADARFITVSGMGHGIDTQTWRAQIDFFRDAIAADSK